MDGTNGHFDHGSDCAGNVERASPSRVESTSSGTVVGDATKSIRTSSIVLILCSSTCGFFVLCSLLILDGGGGGSGGSYPLRTCRNHLPRIHSIFRIESHLDRAQNL